MSAAAKRRRGKGKAKAVTEQGDVEREKPVTSVKWSEVSTMSMLNEFVAMKLEGKQAQSGWTKEERARIANGVLRDSHLKDGGVKKDADHVKRRWTIVSCNIAVSRSASLPVFCTYSHRPDLLPMGRLPRCSRRVGGDV